MSKKQRKNTKHGDTIVEAVIAIAIYSVVAVLALASMNSGLKSAQKSLESTMARAAVDSQVDAIRYIYENYIIARGGGSQDDKYFKFLWEKQLKDQIVDVDNYTTGKTLADTITDPDNVSSCQELMNGDQKIFAINTRALYSQERLGGNPPTGSHISGLAFSSTATYATASKMVILRDTTSTNPNVTTTSLYPRITYKAYTGSNEEVASILIGSNKGGDIIPTREAISAQGVWVVLVHEDNKDSYDFYVRTCWNAAGEKAPTTNTTVVRVYKVD